MTPRQIILLGDKTLSGVERILNQQLQKAAVAWVARDAGFDTWTREIMDPGSQTNLDSKAALGFMLSPRILDRPDVNAVIDGVLGSIQAQGSKRTVVFSNIFPDPTCILPLTSHAEAMAAAADINSRLYAFAHAHSWFHVVDHVGLALREGIRSLTDLRFESTAQMYFSPAGSRKVAELWTRLLRALSEPAAKVLVVDLDNTLWKGILGEDGAEGIEMGSDANGWAYRRLQQALLRLKQNGVLLGISSKNNYEETIKVIAEHPDCLLRPDDFSAIEIGWGTKSESLERMSKRLRLGLDAFVFLDDSAFEREEVRKAHPQVKVLDFPSDPLALIETLSNTFVFDSPRITAEDRERNNSYVAEAQREALKEKNTSPESFFQSLALRAKFFRGRDVHADRLHQLLLKTNQFNLTTKRMEADNFRALMETEGTLIVGIRVADKFGDSGVTGLAIIEGVGTTTWTVDNFLLSCRVIGRTVENGFVAWLAEKARSAGATIVRFKFKATARNQVAKDFLDKSGLIAEESEELWRIAITPDGQQLAPHYLTIDDSEFDA